MKISEHVSYTEATKSATAERKGIYNTPNASELQAMQLTSIKIFEPVRKAFRDKPIRITSFFRSVELNRAIGGSSSTSQHCKGQAMDIDADGSHTSNRQIFQYIIENLSFDQLIWEFGDNLDPDWLHVSYVSEEQNRGQILKAVRIDGRTKYINYEG